MNSGGCGAKNRRGAVPMETLPEVLSDKPEDYHLLSQWRDLKLGWTQQQVAGVAGKQQARISSIELGHLPRKKLWPDFLSAYSIDEANFYRMVMNAKKLRAQKAEARFPLSVTHPLLATAQADVPAVITPMISQAPAKTAGLA